MSTPHPKLVELLEKHGLTLEDFQRKGRLPPDKAHVLERRRDLVTELHAAGTPWAEMIAITGLAQPSIQRLTKAMWNGASRTNVSENAAERGRARKGEKKPWLSEQLKQQWADGKFDFHKNRTWTPEEKERLRKSKHGRQGVWKLIDTDKGGRIFTRSSWERVAAAKLDADPNVVRFEFERPFEVPGARTIFPDFIVFYTDGSIVLTEVKPKFLTEQPADHKDMIRLRLARDVAEARGWGFQIWTEVELGIPTKYRESSIPADQLPYREVKGPVRSP